MTQIFRFVNTPLSFNLSSLLSSGATTLTPPSYASWPTTGQFALKCDNELFYVTNAATHPWPLARGQEGTTAASHVSGTVVYPPLTAGAMAHWLAAQQGGVLTAIGQVLDFTGGAVVTQEGDGIIGVAVGGTTATINFVIDGGGVVVATGSKGLVEIGFACLISAVRLVADQAGDVQVTIKKADYATLPTTTSIVAAAPPSLASAQKSEDATLTGWTKAIAAGEWLEYVVDSATLVQRVSVSLTVTRS